ncbi:hypothetical protein BGZ54_009368 [Gamsiella multidivaricata]|nr:hypothetical protein BGZ54_009368 [Gamsiella multidivaricata]
MSLYTYSWDVYMDWGLFRFGRHGGGAYGHPFLRAELVYPHQWVYYLAIVLNFFGRFAWVLRLAPFKINAFALSFIMALIEVLRRWIWNFFRLENEHLNNCGQFRAIKDIPLPFHIRVEGESEEEKGDEGEGWKSHEQGDHERGAAVKSQGEHDLGVLAGESGSTSKAPGTDTASRSRRQGLSRSASSRSGRGAALQIEPEGHAGTSQASVHSAAKPTGSVHRKAPRRRPSQTSEGPFGIQRSNSFVDQAMTEAGIDALQKEHLTALNKFYDRRDFDTKIIDAPHEPLKPGTRPNTVGSSRSLGIGLANDEQDGASNVNNAAEDGRQRRCGHVHFNWGEDSDEEEDSDDYDEA